MITYPVELNLRGRGALVVGLGSVGRRKAAGLVEAGACVLVVDPAPDREIPESLSGKAFDFRREAYRDEHLDGMSLVVAAAIPEVNRRVVIEARRRAIWVCSASDPEQGDFTVPASWRSGPLCVTVSTSGASPALAAALRDRAVAALGQGAAELATLFAELRPEVKSRVTDPEIRRRIFAGWGDPRWLECFATSGSEVTVEALRREYEILGGLDRP